MHEKNEMLGDGGPLELGVECSLDDLHKAITQASGDARRQWTLPFERIEVLANFNPRRNDAVTSRHVESLASSIESNGFYPNKPLLISVGAVDGRLNVIDGHCRLQALRLLKQRESIRKIEMVPVVVMRGLSYEDLQVALVRFNEKSPLRPLEIGVVIQRLLGCKIERVAIAKRLGITPRYVNFLEHLISAPVELQDMIGRGQISATNVVKVMQAYGESALQVVLDQLGEESKTGNKRFKFSLSTKTKFSSAAKAIAPQMASAIVNVQNDPAFDALSVASQKQLLDVLDVINGCDDAVTALAKLAPTGHAYDHLQATEEEIVGIGTDSLLGVRVLEDDYKSSLNLKVPSFSDYMKRDR